MSSSEFARAVSLLLLLVAASPVQGTVITEGGVSWIIVDDSSEGFSVVDATIVATGQGDAFDRGLILRVNGSFLTGGLFSPVTTVNGKSLVMGPQTLSGLNVSTQYFAHAGSPTMRTISIFENPTGSAINAAIIFETNVGSDGGTLVALTSSGDIAFTTADRWVITDDSTTGGDPTNVHVFYGPDSPAVTPSASFLTTTFNSAGNEGVRDEFSLLVPGGSTLALMFFNQIRTTAADAIANVGTFDSNASVAGAGLLADLPAGLDLGQIVNWNFAPNAVIPEPSTLVIAGMGALALAARVPRRRRKVNGKQLT